jgi:hypothetical protein
MQRSDFLVNAIVCYVDNDGHARGVVIGHSASNPSKVAVEWDNGVLESVDYTQLELVDTALEADFKKIQEVLNSAVKLLNEANAIARQRKSSLANFAYDDHINFDDVFEALDDAGWSSSSMRC